MQLILRCAELDATKKGENKDHMKNEIQIFNNPDFGEVRTLSDRGKEWFVGKDVAVALGYKDTTNALKQHCRDDGVVIHHLTDKMGRKQQAKFIDEGNLYRLITHSKLPVAEKFERWVFDEVLPSIRETGSYSVKPMTEYQKMVIDAQQRRSAIQSAKILLGLAERYKGTTYEQVLHANATKELTGEFLLPLPELKAKTYSATDIGKLLGVSARKIGNLSEHHGMKTEEYGEWFKDKAAHHNGEVPAFRYYENAIDVFRGLLED